MTHVLPAIINKKRNGAVKSKLAHLDNIIFYTLCAAPLLLLIILGCKLLALVYNYSSPDFGS